MAQAILEARSLYKVYQTRGVETPALRGVDLAIAAGEFTVLAGPSGSGKTTLLNLFGALDAPTSGSVYLEGQDLLKLSNSRLAELRLRRLGFVFQSYNLVPVFSALENVEFVMQLQGVAPKERRVQACAVLEQVGLAELLHKRPLEMSGGQQQRVAVARAIASQPAVVLADEPTANLDSDNAAQLLDVMERLNRERGITFLFSTHDARVMARARRMVRLSDGRIAGEEEQHQA